MLLAVEIAVPKNAVTRPFVFFKIPTTPRIRAATSKTMPAMNRKTPSIQPACPETKTTENKKGNEITKKWNY